jgi:hypothetical protein
MDIRFILEDGKKHKGCFFKNAEEISELLTIGTTYVIDKGTVKKENSAYADFTGQLKILFYRNSNIIEVACSQEIENSSGKEQEKTEDELTESNSAKVTFIRIHKNYKLEEIVNLPKNTTVDVKGVVIHIEPPEKITSKNRDKIELRKILLADDSYENGAMIIVVFWGGFEDRLIFDCGDVIQINKAKVSQFNFISLNVNSIDQVQKIDHDEVLSPWYEGHHDMKALEPLSDMTYVSFYKENWIKSNEFKTPDRFKLKLIQEVKEGYEEKDKTTHVIYGTLLVPRIYPNIVYIGCPEHRCKVAQESDRLWK